MSGPQPRENAKGRREDLRMLTGRGRFLADFVGPETLFAGFVRADQASARITRLNTDQAKAKQGVRAVITASDLDRAGIGPLQHRAMPRDDGEDPSDFPMQILCGEAVRHIGEPVALVIADTKSILADAIEAVEVDLEDALPVDGLAYLRRFGDQTETEAAMAAVLHRHRVRFDIPRVTAFALEPRCSIARWGGDGRLQFRTSTQKPFVVRSQMAALFGWDPATIQVVAEDVGGSFGMKGFLTREDAALAWAAHHLSAEIAWLPSRSETMLADAQGRGASGWVEVGLDDGLHICAVQAQFDIDLGAYPSERAFGVINNINGLTGMYRMPNVFVEVKGYVSPRPPLTSFRGNGRPEVTHAIERALDASARSIGVDPVVLRKRNLLTPTEMPATTGLGTVLDCGDFPKVMEQALSLQGSTEDRRRAAEAKGMLFGVGIANCVESAGGPLRKPRLDCARLTLEVDGSVSLAAGVMSVGQGHETALSNMVAERLQIEPALVNYLPGDTDALSMGRGNGGSAGLTVTGSAVWHAIDDLIAKGCFRTAEVLGCDAGDVFYREGVFHQLGTNENRSFRQLAACPGGLDVETSFAPRAATFPNGTHICEVEIDRDTGKTRVTRYVAVEDIGLVLNPMLVAGQMQGGIAQGLSLGLGEQMVFDDDNQIQTGSLMDYALIRADDMSMIETDHVEVSTAMNPLGVKGVGEAGTVGATAALASAVSDALWRAGVKDFDLPATPFRVWQALQDLKRVRG